MQIEYIIKRDSSKKAYEQEKITQAILKAMKSVNNGEYEDAKRVSSSVYDSLLERAEKIPYYVPNIEEIQDLVEQKLMTNEYFEVAKSYILYRNLQTEKRKRNIFEKRVNLKPYQYPELYEYVPAIRHSYWIHTEFNFTSDIHDFKTRLNDSERNAIKNTLLAISQIVVAV